MKAELVLDKSFLRSAPPDTLAKLCGEYRVIMPGALFFELLTGDPEVGRECFARLPPVLNPVELVDHVGKLLQYEAQHSRPSPSLLEVRRPMVFKFNPKLATGDFELTREHREGISEWQSELANEVDLHKRMAATTHEWFPEVAESSCSGREAAIARAAQLVHDIEFVRARYGSIRYNSSPPEHVIDSHWTHYRWMQVHLLAALEYIRRYGPGQPDQESKRIENDVVDMQYEIMALVCRRLATKDKAMRDTVLALEPEVQVIGQRLCA